MNTKSPVPNDEDPRAKREFLRREEIHRSILLAAERIIIAKGYTAMTMDDVAREAGLSKATLYKYIPSKERILFEIASRYLDEATEIVRKVVDSNAGSAEKLREIIREVIRFQRARSNISRILLLDKATIRFMRLMLAADGKSGSDQFNKNLDILKRKNQDIVKLFVKSIEEGVATGEFRPLDPLETAHFIGAFLEGINHSWVWKKQMNDLSEGELARRIFVFIFASLRNPAGPARADLPEAPDKKSTNAPAGERKESTNA